MSTAMPATKRDGRHQSSTIPGCTTRPSHPTKPGNPKHSVRSPGMVSLPLLPPAELGGRAPTVRPSPAFMQGPQPGRPLSPMRFSPVLPALSTAELPRLVSEVGPDVAVGDCAWMEGPQLMASALGVQIPRSATQLSCEQFTVER